jgi:NAD-dependent dihydropyrimidine dehydrogenase PreA subunit
MVAQANFVVAADTETCTGCGDCIDRCQLEALSLEGDLVSVDEELCVGCANCVPACPTESLSMVRRADEVPPESKDTLYRLGMA